MRLKFRLTLSFLAVTALGAAISFALVRSSSEALFRSFVFSGDAAKAEAYAGLLAEYYRAEDSWEGVQDFLESLPSRFSAMVEGDTHGGGASLEDLLSDRIVLVDSGGVVVADTAHRLVSSVHPREHVDHGAPVETGLKTAGTVLVGSMIEAPLAGVSERYLADVTGSLALATVISASLALLLGLLLAARVTKPLAGLAAATVKVASGEYHEPLAETGGDEIASLSRAFNAMTAEVRRLDAARKRVIADSAHELRTPVTLIRGMVEGMLDGVYPLDGTTLRSVHEETLRLSRLIDALRELEVIDSGALRLEKESLDVREMTAAAISRFAPSATQKSISLVLDGGGIDCEVLGDRFRMDEVLDNLLSNALKYTQPGGAIRVASLSPGGSLAGFLVEDSGPGIPEAERERVFERFYRVDKSRSADSGGRGLGLAIAAEIVAAHGGFISVGDSSLGGAAFSVLIPRVKNT